jgi:hypothetical protein
MTLKNCVKFILIFTFCLNKSELFAQAKPVSSSTNKTVTTKSKSLKKKKKKITPAPLVEEEIDIGCGDTAIIGKTSLSEFVNLDIYRRTRWDPEATAYDTATGNGFYQSFFKGDYDAAELPALYAGRKFVILGVEILKNKNTGKDMNIMYLHGDVENSVIWVDFDRAVETKEISFIPAKRKK